jgi:hypothetical protein
MRVLYKYLNFFILKEENGEICSSDSECKGGLCVIYGPIMISITSAMNKRCSCPTCPIPIG